VARRNDLQARLGAAISALEAGRGTRDAVDALLK
jgi:hypothetical protein